MSEYEHFLRLFTFYEPRLTRVFYKSTPVRTFQPLTLRCGYFSVQTCFAVPISSLSLKPLFCHVSLPPSAWGEPKGGTRYQCSLFVLGPPSSSLLTRVVSYSYMGSLCLFLPFWFLYQIKTEAKCEISATFAKVRRERQPARSLFIHCSKSLGYKDKSQFPQPRIG